LKTVPGEAIRYALLSAHYRKPLNWTKAGLDRAKHALDRLYLTLSKLPGPDEADPDQPAPMSVKKALIDDLNTPKAQAALFDLARQANSSSDDKEQRDLKGALLSAGNLLGLFQTRPETWLTSSSGDTTVDSTEIERMLEERRKARDAKDFETADRIRDQLEAEGVILEDGPDKTRWRLG